LAHHVQGRAQVGGGLGWRGVRLPRAGGVEQFEEGVRDDIAAGGDAAGGPGALRLGCQVGQKQESQLLLVAGCGGGRVAEIVPAERPYRSDKSAEPAGSGRPAAGADPGGGVALPEPRRGGVGPLPAGRTHVDQQHPVLDADQGQGVVPLAPPDRRVAGEAGRAVPRPAGGLVTGVAVETQVAAQDAVQAAGLSQLGQFVDAQAQCLSEGRVGVQQLLVDGVGAGVSGGGPGDVEQLLGGDAVPCAARRSQPVALSPGWTGTWMGRSVMV
jgi:hypothetical protein